MANLPESSAFDSVYQIETNDPVVGGVNGITNKPLIGLTNRTKYLKDHVDALESGETPAGSAKKLATGCTIELINDVSGAGLFDGEKKLTIEASIAQASETISGKVLLASIAEAESANNNTKAVTPAGLANYWNTQKMSVVAQIAFFASLTAPVGWLKCNGAEISRAAYAELFDAIGTTYGAGDGSTTFNLPDLRGEFIRGLDEGRGLDPNRTLGSNQNDELRSHDHTLTIMLDRSPASPGNAVFGDEPYYGQAIPRTHPTGGAETRPRNLTFIACIKY